MSAFTPSFVKKVVKKVFPELPATHLENLSLGILGQIKSQSGLMSEIVRFIPGTVKHKHRLKRFWRFLSNPRIKPEHLRAFWVTWCARTFCPDGVIKIAMDWTTLPGNIQCLMIAIPVHGRAIPLLWQLILYSDIKDSQNMIEERLVARLVNLIKENFPDKKLLLTADRGFGRATLFQFLLKKEVIFVIRVKGDVQIKTDKGKTIMLRKLGKRLIPGKVVWYENISYRSDGKVTGVNFAAVVAEPKEGEADPWFLITNLTVKEETIKRYEERFHIEECFKDLKHQLGIAQIQTKNLKRVRRLLFLAIVSSGILMVVGNVGDSLATVKDTLITGRNKAASRIWFALKLIQKNLAGRSFFAKVYAVAGG